jgi:hypothetical protein
MKRDGDVSQISVSSPMSGLPARGQNDFGFSVFRFKNSKRPILSKQRKAS